MKVIKSFNSINRHSLFIKFLKHREAYMTKKLRSKGRPLVPLCNEDFSEMKHKINKGARYDDQRHLKAAILKNIQIQFKY